MKVQSDWRVKSLEHANVCHECNGSGYEDCACGGDPSERCEACNGSNEQPCHVCAGKRFDVELDDEQRADAFTLIHSLAGHCESMRQGVDIDGDVIQWIQDRLCGLYSLPSVGWMRANNMSPSGQIGRATDEGWELSLYWFQGSLMAGREQVESVVEAVEFQRIDLVA